MESTYERALNGLIELWLDIYDDREYLIQEKVYQACQLQPHIMAALREPSLWVTTLIESSLDKVAFSIIYTLIPIEVRHHPMLQAEIKQDRETNLFLFFLNWLLELAATTNMVLGITLAEAERWLEQSFERMVTQLSLNQMLSKPTTEKILHWYTLHTLSESFPLYPGSVAGADRKLRVVLRERMRLHSGNICVYENDLRAALWDCWNSDVIVTELFRILHNKSDREKVELLEQLADGEEPKLLRNILLESLHKVVGNLADIHQEIRNLQTQGRELPLTEEILSVLPARHEQYESALDNFLDMITKRGVDISRLDTRDLELLSDELNRRKYSITRKEYYGEKENQRKQQLKYLGKRLKS